MDCENCPFKEGPKVPGEGPDECDLVVVAMAPADEEVQQGRVLVGKSGKMLRGVFSQLGVKEAYLCNVLLCPISTDSDADVTKAVKCCRDVKEEILARKPKLTVALGNLPLSILTDEGYGIKECEGRIMPSKVGPLLPLVHPAAYLRRPDDAFDFVECSRSGLKFLKGTYQQAGEPNLVVVTPDNLSEVRQTLGRGEYLAVDSETTGFAAYGWEPDEIMEIGMSIDHNTTYVATKELVPEFKDLLEEKKCLFWNAQFDCAFLKAMGINANNYFDGMLAHYTLDERLHSHGLKRVAQIYLGADDWEKDIAQYLPNKKESSYANIPTDKRYEYLAKDVTRTYQLFEVLRDELNEKTFYDILMPASRMFVEIEYKGIQINPVLMMQMEAILGEDLEALEKEIMDLTGIWLNPNSPKQVSEYVYGKLNLPVDPHYGFSTSKEYLDGFRDIPVIDRILNYKVMSKMKGTYIEGFAKFVDKKYRIHPTFKIFGTVTGRLSSERPNVQNIKSDSRLKQMFLPDVGSIMGSMDWKRMELQWYYLYSGDEGMGKILRDPNGDPHNVVSVQALGVEPGETKEETKAKRTKAKTAVFGRLYKRSRESIEREFGSEGLDELMATVDGLFPGAKKYTKDIMDQVHSKGYLESYFGRRRRFPLITYQNRGRIEKQAVNFPIQSAASDLNLLTMLELYRTYKEHGVWPLWCVHDSIEMNAESVGAIEAIIPRLEEFANDLTGHQVPFQLDLDWGIDWSMRKSEEE